MVLGGEQGLLRKDPGPGLDDENGMGRTVLASAGSRTPANSAHGQQGVCHATPQELYP